MIDPNSDARSRTNAWTGLARHLANGLSKILPPTQLFGLRRLAYAAGQVTLAKSAKICGGSIIFGRGTFQVGDSTWISPGLSAFTHLEAPISIGARCDIGPQVSLVTGTHAIGESERRAGHGAASPITIGDGCWIGAGVLILGGVIIGNGAIVAAGSVVTKDIPPETLAAGVPAVPKRRLL